MNKIDHTVRRETCYVAAWTVILSAVMQAVFLLLGKWSSWVLIGNICSAAVGVGNFLLLGVTVQRAVAKEDEKEAKAVMRASQSLRTVAMFALAAVAVAVLRESTPAVIAFLIPLLFPRISLLLRPAFGALDDGTGAPPNVNREEEEHESSDSDGT